MSASDFTISRAITQYERRVQMAKDKISKGFEEGQEDKIRDARADILEYLQVLGALRAVEATEEGRALFESEKASLRGGFYRKHPDERPRGLDGPWYEERC